MIRFIAILLFALPAFAGKGAADGGGADIPQSSEYDVEQAVKYVMTTGLNVMFYNLAYVRGQVKDPYVARILSYMYSKPLKEDNWEENQPILKDIKTTQYELKRDGGCPSPNGDHHPASVPKFEMGAPICFSVPILQNIPKEDLKREVMSYAAHEFAHHFGFGEFESTRFQYFVAHQYKSLTEFAERMIFKFQKIENLAVIGSQPVEVGFQNGKIIRDEIQLRHLRDSDEPNCVFVMGLSDKALDQYFKTKKPIAYDLPDRGMEVMHGTSSGSSDYASRGWLTHVAFRINPVYDGNVYEDTWGKLFASDGKSPSGVVRTLYCRAKGLRLMDIKRAFGPYMALPQLIVEN